jgi:hypothetical protein
MKYSGQEVLATTGLALVLETYLIKFFMNNEAFEKYFPEFININEDKYFETKRS